jgi:oxygen-dependent protoporphyrinogen oxidase
MAEERVRVAVIGGGIAGLAAARRASTRASVTLFDADEEFGGKLRSATFRGRPVDLGPDSFITRNPRAKDFASELGLGDELVAPSGGFAAIFARGAIRRFPSGLAIGIPTATAPLLRAGVLSPIGALRSALDYVLPRASNDEDPSVADLIGKRLGRAVLYELVDPLVGGINASDVDVLSFRAALPDLAARLGQTRSVMRALRAPRGAPPPASGTPIFLGLRNGIATLVSATISALHDAGVEVRGHSAVREVRQRARGFALVVNGEEFDYDGVIVATPAFVTGSILAPISAELTSVCSTIEYASVVTVHLAFSAQSLPETTRERLLAVSPITARARLGEIDGLLGNGLLLARGHDELATALTFTSAKWPHSASPGEIVIRASAGRHHDERALDLDDADLVEAMMTDISKVLGITESPLDAQVTRFVRSFPQYTTGHLARVAKIERLLGEKPALALAGAAYHGIGIPACIESGERAADAVLDAIAS